MMKIQELLAISQKKLETSGSDEPQANAQWLLAHVLGKSRTWVLANGGEEISSADEARYADFIERKAQGEPLSHIVGFQPFCGLDIMVTPDVLTPRPETEELVETATSFFDRKNRYMFLDMCTGSGCIAVALAKKFPKAHIVAADISEKALSVARQNALKWGVDNRIYFLKSNLWEEVLGSFDLIISNPPYIPTQVVDTLTQEVLREPRLALDGGEDGFDVIRPLCSAAGDYLNAGGLLALEVCKGQASALARGLAEYGWKAEVKKDITGIERFVLARQI